MRITISILVLSALCSGCFSVERKPQDVSVELCFYSRVYGNDACTALIGSGVASQGDEVKAVMDNALALSGLPPGEVAASFCMEPETLAVFSIGGVPTSAFTVYPKGDLVYRFPVSKIRKVPCGYVIAEAEAVGTFISDPSFASYMRNMLSEALAKDGYSILQKATKAHYLINAEERRER